MSKIRVIKTFSAHVVRPEDDFDYQYGSDQFLRHKPARKYADSKKWTHAYAIAEFANGGCQFEVMNYDEIMDHKSSIRGVFAIRFALEYC